MKKSILTLATFFLALSSFAAAGNQVSLDIECYKTVTNIDAKTDIYMTEKTYSKLSIEKIEAVVDMGADFIIVSRDEIKNFNESIDHIADKNEIVSTYCKNIPHEEIYIPSRDRTTIDITIEVSSSMTGATSNAAPVEESKNIQKKIHQKLSLSKRLYWSDTGVVAPRIEFYKPIIAGSDGQGGLPSKGGGGGSKPGNPRPVGKDPKFGVRSHNGGFNIVIGDSTQKY